MNINKIKISELKPNPNNPRIIKDDKFKKLVQSIKDFPQMLELRPIVVNEDMIVLGGNMRLKACKEAGLKEVPIIKASELSEEQQKEFIIKDNVGFGEWDWDSLANEWDVEQLEDWGLEIPTFETDVDYSEKNKELDLNDFEDQKYTIKLEYSEDDYNLVKERLQELGQTAEKILYDALISL
jgi:ParB-like chromosome segregation protein Spo0J